MCRNLTECFVFVCRIQDAVNSTMCVALFCFSWTHKPAVGRQPIAAGHRNFVSELWRRPRRPMVPERLRGAPAAGSHRTIQGPRSSLAVVPSGHSPNASAAAG
jgi:hypothetical protein